MHGMSILCLYFGTKFSVIGLTGGIACGKSTVIEFLEDKGKNAFKIIDSDKIVHGLYRNPDFIAKIFKTFGKDEIVAEDGVSVDRAKLGKIIFKDKNKRSQLNKLTQWPIFSEINK